MSAWRKVSSLGVEAPGRMYAWEYDEAPPEDGQVRLETLYSGFSAGTELTFVKGGNPYLHSRWDAHYGVFVEGEPSARFPVPFLGYMEVARVVESRSAVLAAGGTVAMAYGHKSGHVAHPGHDAIFAVPGDVDPMLGVYVAQMGPIAANGLLHAAADACGADVRSLGDGVAGRHVLVIGGGVVGLLCALFARAHGAGEVVVADPSPFRRGASERLGLIAIDEAQAWRWAKDRWNHGGGDRGADVVLQCRAKAESLHGALRALRPQGSVIDLAFYEGGAGALRLGEEFHHNGLAIRCAQIGRVPRGLAAAWTKARLARETVDLMTLDGGAIRAVMVTDVVAIGDAARFVGELVEKRREFLQIVFDYGRA